MRVRRLVMTLAVAALGALSPGGSEAATGGRSESMSVRPASVDNTAYIGVNNLQMLVSNVGSFAYDPSSHFGKHDGLYFPRGSDKTVVYAAGLWIGARVDGEPRVTVAEYTQEFSPGGMDGGEAVPDAGRFHVYKISRGDDASSNPDYAAWPFDEGAPVQPAADGSDSLDAEGNRAPLILGDQSLYAIYNDANRGAHTNQAGSTEPLGLEVQQYVFGFSRSGALGNAVYLKYKLINKGSNLLEDTYVSLWCDPDIGDAGDDFVGCDTALSLGFAYNDGPDPIYGAAAPAVGYDFLQGPIVPSEGDSALVNGGYRQGYRNLPMTSFNRYTNGRDPRSNLQSYNYMQGLTLEGEPAVDPEGDTTLYVVAGDPVTGSGWIDVGADDRRFMMSTGPFSMAPGDTQEVVIAVLVGQGADHLSSITALRDVSTKVQSVFDLNFQIPFPPPQPRVWAQPLPNRIELIWDRSAEGDVQTSEVLGQRFVMEGYNIYQGESETGPWKKIATYDIENDVTRIYMDIYDSDASAFQRLLVASGTDSGLDNHLTISTDRINGGGLINYRPYHFAVSSYSYDEENAEEYLVDGVGVGYLAEVLESRIQGITAHPNALALDIVDTAAHIEGQSEGTVIVRYLEPQNITGSQYEVTFNADRTWNLQNLTTGEFLLSNQVNESGDFDYAITDGVMVQTTGPEPGIDETIWEGGEAWATSVNLGGPWFGGGLVPGAWFFGSSIEDLTQLVDVEIRFSNEQRQLAYRYMRGANPNYGYQDYREIPLTAWDVSVDPPRQLNVCFVEQVGLASADGTWLPDNEDPLSAREYLFVLNSDYSETPDPYYTSRLIFGDAYDFDVLYAWWPAVADGHSNSELSDGQVLRITAAKANTSADRFQFRTLRGGEDVIAAGQASLKGIHPVPNPYFHTTDLEGGSSDGRIEFVGLPATTLTLEIYNLAGELIRTLTKEDPVASTLVWDVKTENGQRPASGMYIYRVVAPGVGTKIGKVAVFTKAEQVRRF